MSILIVVDHPQDWPHELAGAEVVSARRYLTEPQGNGRARIKVFNLCRSYRYQSLGYYVSLLAEARGHRPLPRIETIQDLRQRSLIRLVSEDLESRIQRSLSHLATPEFELSIYFGQNIARRYHLLARDLFNLFPAPLLRAAFRRSEERWQLTSIRPIAMREVPDTHKEFLIQATEEYFARRRVPSGVKPPAGRYDLAILVNPQEKEPPSNERALQRFARAAQTVGFAVEMLGPDDIGHIAEFDALFIRETTAVTHHTYRFSRRAEAEGLVVIDDPQSILRCTNKVYLAEALTRAGVPTPRTWVLHRDNLDALAGELPYPCVLKRPDSSFSQGVSKLDTSEAFVREAKSFMESSDLVVAQEFLHSEYDWRIGVLGGRALWACKYFMAPEHWQIIKRSAAGRVQRYGEVETLAIEQVPQEIVREALAASALMGDGLYGVDLKSAGDRCYVIEVNDNPNIDAGVEDAVLGEELYRSLAEEFLHRVERLKSPPGARP
jgi:glutathione synthase/RimK-type ligase-like ATP-grasp enzyme